MPFYSPDYFKNPIKLNRPISGEERDAQLKQKDEQPGFDESVPHYQLSVIQHNSTFVEIVDRNYPARGIATALSLITFLLFTVFIVAIWIMTLQKWGDDYHSGRIITAMLMSVVCLAVICAAIYPLLRESFHYTHLPIRLNRKNRTIYIWRKTGVVTASWDRTVFFMRKYKDTALYHWDVRGNILAEDDKTVIDSFPLSSYDSIDKQDLQHHFEYFRRYMEVGPQQTCRMLKVCLPIAKRREIWWEGFMRLLLLMHGSLIMQILFSPFWFLMSLSRWFAMHTSKIPQWPDWVEKECAIESNDPYVRESGYVAPRE